jgi:hypothetical protein
MFNDKDEASHIKECYIILSYCYIIYDVRPGDNPPILFASFLIITALSGTVYFLLTPKPRLEQPYYSILYNYNRELFSIKRPNSLFIEK